jgi:hypothetical protein
MSDEELEKVLEPLLSACKHIAYDEAVVIGSAVGQLITNIKELRDKQEVYGPLVYPKGMEE